MVFCSGGLWSLSDYLRSLPAPPKAHRFSGGFAVLPRQAPGDGRTVPSATIVPSPGDLPAPGAIPPLKRWAWQMRKMTLRFSVRQAA
jgi:hypothetical protein